MKILYLGPFRQQIADYLESMGDEVVHTEKRLKLGSSILEGVDMILSYGYMYILKEDLLRQFPHRVINMHISYLPWNRGADPNLWSFLEDTPKGVSIHYIDSGVDTGLLIAQKRVEMVPDDTLATSYDRLTQSIIELFFECWLDIRNGRVQGIKQADGGAAHRMKDKEPYEHHLSQGWDTPVKYLIGQALVRHGED